MALIDIPQYRSELAEIRKSLLAAGDALHIDHIREQLDELTEEMNQPEFWNDPDHSAKVNQKVSNLKGKLEHYEKLLSSADDIEVMLEMAEEEKDEDTVTEAVDELATLKEHTDALELETLMRGDYDDNDAVLSLHAGAGGTEAQDWTSMLYRMYTRYCEKMGFTVKLLDLLDGDEAGIKSVTFEVSGDHAYGYLRGEKGVHRLVRISPFDANARRHTSFASLDVAPMLEDEDKMLTDKAGCRARAYDIVLNGTELGGGSIRINTPEMQTKAFEALGISDEDIQERFGHLVNAFQYGAPPHGGLAYGLDRLVMLMTGASSIRDVIAFPKVQNASDLMMNCPDVVDDKQLDDLSIAVTRMEETPAEDEE